MKSMPGFTAESSLYRSATAYQSAGAVRATGGSQVLPQACASTGCLRLGGGRHCLTLPIVGRVCVNIPRIGGWRIRCCLRFGWPPVSCSVESC
jgi:hypothetical protein